MGLGTSLGLGARALDLPLTADEAGSGETSSFYVPFRDAFLCCMGLEEHGLTACSLFWLARWQLA